MRQAKINTSLNVSARDKSKAHIYKTTSKPKFAITTRYRCTAHGILLLLLITWLLPKTSIHVNTKTGVKQYATRVNAKNSAKGKTRLNARSRVGVPPASSFSHPSHLTRTYYCQVAEKHSF
jgi:hypothetical protein